MNVQGIGVDLCEIDRIARLIDLHGNRFLDKLFTSAEKSYCQRKYRAAESFAVRFAAKEALLKAIGTGLRENFRWKDIEITNNDLGMPEFKFYGKTADLMQNSRVMLSLSHSDQHAVAFVMIL